MTRQQSKIDIDLNPEKASLAQSNAVQSSPEK